VEIVRQPPFMQLIEQYRQEILAGRLKEGDALPSARQLSAEHGIGLNTAVKVIEGLRALGLADTVVGVGSFVTRKPEALADPAAPLTRDLLRQKREVVAARAATIAGSANVTAALVAAAPRRVTSELGLPARSRAVRRTQVTSRGGQVRAICTSWFPASLSDTIPQLLAQEPLPATLPGFKPNAGEDRISARAATAAEATALGAEPGTPVLSLRRRLYGASGQVLEYTEMTARRGEPLDLSYRLARGRFGG
jgi:DNA-binding GntR family transcriptional regulator